MQPLVFELYCNSAVMCYSCDYLLRTFAHFLQLFYVLLSFYCSRHYLAALHYNENADRGQATTSSGDPLSKVQEGRVQSQTSEDMHDIL